MVLRRRLTAAAAAVCLFVTAAATIGPGAAARPAAPPDGVSAGVTPAAPSAGCGTSAVVPGDTTVTTSSSAVERTYIRHVPPQHDGESPVPLVIALHGLGEGSVLHQRMTEYASRADAHGFVTVYPQALGATPTWNVAAGSTDVVFVGDVLDELEATLCVDTNRIYISGFSLGAFLTTTLMCGGDLGLRIAAVAPVAGLRNPAGCTASRAVPAITFHGTADTWVSHTGTPEMVAAWAARNGCGPTPTTTAVPGDDVVTIDHVVYPCPGGGDVELYDITGGGHAWPGSEFSRAIATAVGYTTFAISATDLIWDFFEAHPLPVASGVVEGRVVDAAGAPVPGVRVGAYADGDGFAGTAAATTAADGSYSITGVPGGSYAVAFVPMAGSGLQIEWYGDQRARGDATPVTVTPGEAVTAVDAALAASATIEGTVIDAGGAPVPGAMVWAYATSDTWVGSAVASTDPAGAYELGGLIPGTYRLLFTAPGTALRSEWFDDSASRAGAEPLTVAVGGPVPIADATLTP